LDSNIKKRKSFARERKRFYKYMFLPHVNLGAAGRAEGQHYMLMFLTGTSTKTTHTHASN